MDKVRFSEAAFIASSAGNFKFQNVEKRDTEKSYVSEWVNSLFGREEEDPKKRIHETLEDTESEDVELDDTDLDDIEIKKAFLKAQEYDPERPELLEKVHICDSSEDYHFSSRVGDVILNNSMLDDWQQTHSDLKEALDKAEADFYFDWDEMISEAQVNGEITFGEFEFNGETYFGYGYFN